MYIMFVVELCTKQIVPFYLERVFTGASFEIRLTMKKELAAKFDKIPVNSINLIKLETKSKIIRVELVDCV